MKKTILLLLCLPFAIQNYLQGQIFEAGDIAYHWVSANKYGFTITAYVTDSTKAQKIIIYFGDGDSSICSSSYTAGVFTDTISHTYPGAGTYHLTATLRNRVSGIQNIPNSNTTAIGLTATLVINPFLGSGHCSSPSFLNSPLSLGRLSIYSYNSIGSDPDGDSLSYKLTPCLNAPGFTFPATTGTFSLDSLTGYLTWNAPVSTGNYNFCILIEKWRQGFLIGSVLREIEVNIVQKYQATLDSVNVWSYTGTQVGERLMNHDSLICSYPLFNDMGNTSEYTFSDTIIHGYVYKWLYLLSDIYYPRRSCFIGWVREDTAKRTIYFRDRDSVETVLYNFSMQLKDTINIKIYALGYFQSGKYILDSIKTVTLNSKKRSEFYLNCHTCSTSHTLSWVEGVGNLAEFVYSYSGLGFVTGGGLFYPCLGFQYRTTQLMTCFEHNTKVYYDSCALHRAQNGNCLYFADSCNYGNTCFGIKEYNPFGTITIFPNPASASVTVKTSKEMPCTIQLIDLLGQVVYSNYQPMSTDFTVDVGTLPKGLYIIQLTDIQNNVAGRQKLVVQ